MEQTTNHQNLRPGYFFLSLGVLVTLVATVASFLNLVFDTLNKNLPDVLNASYQYGYNSYQYDNIRAALATLIIVFPVFLVLSHFWKKMTNFGMGRIDEVIRKWMLYLIVFFSSVVVLVDLVQLVRYFVSGEITTRFLLKVLVALITAGMVGIYYIFELRSKDMRSRAGTVFAIAATLLVLGAVCYSFAVMGGPAKQRKLRLDDRRVTDLQSLQWQIISFWQQKEKLPEKLDDIRDPLSGYSIPVEPEFEKGKTYDYEKTGDLSFKLCAEFALPMPHGWQEYSGGGVRPLMGGVMEDRAISYYPGGSGNESWDHEGGYTCFERTIDTDIYQPYPKRDI